MPNRNDQQLDPAILELGRQLQNSTWARLMDQDLRDPSAEVFLRTNREIKRAIADQIGLRMDHLETATFAEVPVYTTAAVPINPNEDAIDADFQVIEDEPKALAAPK